MLRLKQNRKEEKAAAEASAEASAASSDGAVAEAKSEATAMQASEDKKEIKLFNSVGGVALKNDGAKSGRQITPGELRIQRGENAIIRLCNTLFSSFLCHRHCGFRWRLGGYSEFSRS